MTNAEIKVADIKQKKNIADADRASRENIASKDRKTKKDIADKDRKMRWNEAKLKSGTRLLGDSAKLIPNLATMAANDPKWWTEGFDANEQQAIIPSNFKNDAYASPEDTRDVILTACLTIPTQGAGYREGEIIQSPPTFTDPVNRAFQIVMTELQSKAGYNLDFQASDVGLMLLSIREIVANIHFIGKIFRQMKTAKNFQSAYPTAIVNALGMDADDLRTNYSAYKQRFLTLLPLLDVLPAPDLPLYHRAAQMFGSTWMDDEYKDQTYAYKATRYHVKPFGFRVLGTNTGAPSSLVMAPAPQSMFEALNLLERQITAILSRDDFKEIAGRLTAIYEKAWNYRDVVLDEEQVAYYEPLMLQQIHNAIVVGNLGPSTPPSAEDKYVFNIHTNEAGLIFMDGSSIMEADGAFAPDSSAQRTFMVPEFDKVHLSHDVPVSAGAVIDATRLHCDMIINGSTPVTVGEQTYMETHIYSAWDIITSVSRLHYSDGTPGVLTLTPKISSTPLSASGGSANAVGAIIDNSVFVGDAYHMPGIYVLTRVQDQNFLYYQNPFLRDNYLTLPMASYNAMNQMASLSVLGVSGRTLSIGARNR